MQFLPGTWARYASDGDGDGVADPQNLYDATLAAARYLCSGGLNLRDQSQVLAAILRYNNSMPYAQNVLGWAAAYATGVVPVDLPPLTGPPPPLGDMHLENPEGLGPNLPLNVHGLPSTDPLAQMPLIDLSGTPSSSQQPALPWQRPGPYAPSCTVICIGQEPGPPSRRSIRRRPTRHAAPQVHRPAARHWPPAAPLPRRQRARACRLRRRSCRRRRRLPGRRRSPAPAGRPAHAAAPCQPTAPPPPDRAVPAHIVAELHSAMMSDPTADVRAALAKVIDPELRRPITELGMVKGIEVGPDGDVHVEIYLTTAACPKKTEISERVRQAVADVPGTGAVKVSLDVMNDEQRTELRKQLRGDAREPVIPFAQPGSLTRVYAVASGKGGVGKSTVTVNLAAAMAARGVSVGLLDADIHGHSIPRMMGTADRPTQVESMILPPIAHEVKVISIAQFTEGNTPVVWRGPMLHRALQQFLADVYWGDLDVLLLDLPPGTGDIAISVAQLIPNAEILVVTTPQLAAAEVAERAGSIALQTRQRIVGVVENMSWLAAAGRLDSCRCSARAAASRSPSGCLAQSAPTYRCWGRSRWTPRWSPPATPGCRSCSALPTPAWARSCASVADGLSSRRRGLAGMSLGLDPTRR